MVMWSQKGGSMVMWSQKGGEHGYVTTKGFKL